MLRKRGVVGKFVEFFGEGCLNLTLADRATVSNMAPEYGATIGYFPIDDKTIDYLRLTGRSEEKIAVIEAYAKASGFYRTYGHDHKEPTYSGAILELDLGTVVPCVSGPKRPHDRVALTEMKQDFTHSLTNAVGFKGFGLTHENAHEKVDFTFDG